LIQYLTSRTQLVQYFNSYLDVLDEERILLEQEQRKIQEEAEMMALESARLELFARKLQERRDSMKYNVEEEVARKDDREVETTSQTVTSGRESFQKEEGNVRDVNAEGIHENQENVEEKEELDYEVKLRRAEERRKRRLSRDQSHRDEEERLTALRDTRRKEMEEVFTKEEMIIQERDMGDEERKKIRENMERRRSDEERKLQQVEEEERHRLREERSKWLDELERQRRELLDGRRHSGEITFKNEEKGLVDEQKLDEEERRRKREYRERQRLETEQNVLLQQIERNKRREERRRSLLDLVKLEEDEEKLRRAEERQKLRLSKEQSQREEEERWAAERQAIRKSRGIQDVPSPIPQERTYTL